MRLNNRVLFNLVLFILLTKLVVWFYIKFLSPFSMGGGNDSNYYHSVATYESDVVVNFWPIFLRFLNDFGLYNRDMVSFSLLLISLIFIPYLFSRVIKLRGRLLDSRILLYSALLIGFWPTIFYLSFDLYRDIPMYMLTLIGFLFVKRFVEVGGNSFLLFPFFIIIIIFLTLLREYLGLSVVLSYIAFLIYNKTSRYFYTWLSVYVVGLMFFSQTGVLDAILLYRGEEGFEDGGSSLGIGLLGKDPLSFLILYVFSFMSQVFGFYIVNFSALIVFFIESVPFIFSFFYVIRNRFFMTPFAKYLLVFFVVYSTVWVLGNDNLGTAVRLRVPSYLAIFACMFIIYQNKLKYHLNLLKRGEFK